MVYGSARNNKRPMRHDANVTIHVKNEACDVILKSEASNLRKVRGRLAEGLRKVSSQQG